MNQNDRRNAKISEICRVLANACMSENTSLYPQDIMTFVNESKNSDVRELLALHMVLNEADATRRLEKAIECAEAWDALKQRHNADMAISFLQIKIDHNNSIIEARRKEKRDFKKGFDYIENADALVLEYEIEEYEKLLEEEGIWGETDNDVAVETYYQIQQAQYAHELDIVRIATDAYRNNIKHTTIIRFMREKLSSDEERALFLSTYSDTARSAGLDYHFI